MKRKLNIGPRSAKEALIFAQEDFRVNLQAVVHGAMIRKGFDHTELAKQADIPLDRVERFFDDGCDLDVREIARVLHALGLVVAFVQRYDKDL